MDIEKLEGFRIYLKDNPEKARLGLEVKAVYEGQAGRSTVHIGRFSMDGNEIDRETRHYTIPFGAWREVEETIGQQGPTDRMEPVEVALAATAACLVNSISYNTARMGIDTEGLEITVRSKINPRVLFAVMEPKDHQPCLGNVEYDVKVSGDVSDEELKTIKDLCAYSPVHGLVAEAINVSGTVTRV